MNNKLRKTLWGLLAFSPWILFFIGIPFFIHNIPPDSIVMKEGKLKGEFILTRKLNHINLLQKVLDICLPMRYKEIWNYISFKGNCLEPLGDSCPARSSIRRAALPGTDAGASLSGFLAQDWRDSLVRGRLARRMGGPSELLCFRLEMFCPGPLDRLGLAPSV